MISIPIRTRRIVPGDDVVPLFRNGLQRGDILVVSSKAAATAEGRIVNLSTLQPTAEATALSERCGRSAAFCQAVLTETALRNGRVAGTCPGLPPEARPCDGATNKHSRAKGGAVLTELKPQGLEHGTIFTANAGLDESNVEAGFAVGWPEDPVESARKLRQALGDQIRTKDEGQRTKDKGRRTKDEGRRTKGFLSPLSLSLSPPLAVILSDSCLRPRRWGVTAYALAVSGLDPLRDEAGRNDLFGKKLRITKEAVADQLATAANFLMGNADQSVPAVIIRDHGLELSDFEGWVPGIPPEDDLFRGII